VTNSWCQTWDVKNLFVTDGGVFPSNADKNPTLTIMALAWRASDRILDLDAQEGALMDRRDTLKWILAASASPLLQRQALGGGQAASAPALRGAPSRARATAAILICSSATRPERCGLWC
jgi:hypothetical protein